MKNLPLLCTAILLLAAAGAEAQDSEADQAAVWAAVEKSWTADERGDDSWIEDMLTDDFMGWVKNSPAPQSKSSVRMWNEFNDRRFQGVAHELYPLSIVVHGDMAVAHYLYTNAVERQDETSEVFNGRYTDVFVREEGEWKYIAWHGGNDD